MGEECAIQGSRGTPELARSKQPWEQRVLITIPLGNGERRVRTTETICNQAGEQGSPFGVQSLRGTRIWQGGNDRGEAQPWGVLESWLTAVVGP